MIELSRCCPCAPGKSSDRRTNANDWDNIAAHRGGREGRNRRRQLPCHGTGHTSSAASSRMCPLTSTLAWTTRRATRPSRSATGPLTGHGWHPHFTPTSASWTNRLERFFAPSANHKSSAGPTARPRPWKPQSRHISIPEMPIQSRSAGPSPQTRSSPRSLASADEPLHVQAQFT